MYRHLRDIAYTHKPTTLFIPSHVTPVQPLQGEALTIHPVKVDPVPTALFACDIVAVPVAVATDEEAPAVDAPAPLVAAQIVCRAQNCRVAPTPVEFPVGLGARKSFVADCNNGTQRSQGKVVGPDDAVVAKRFKHDWTVYAAAVVAGDVADFVAVEDEADEIVVEVESDEVLLSVVALVFFLDRTPTVIAMMSKMTTMVLMIITTWNVESEII